MMVRKHIPSWYMVIVLFWLGVEQSIAQHYLLQNPNDLVPVRQLVEKDLHVVYVGAPINERVRREITLHQDVVSWVDGSVDMSHLRYGEGDLVLYFIASNGSQALDSVMARSEGAEFIWCFRNVPPQQPGDVGAVVYVDEHTNDALQRTIHAIFGATPFNKQLTYDVGSFKQGQGLNTAGNWRLRYPDVLEEVAVGPLYDTMSRIIDQGIAQGAFPGAQLMVVHEGRIIIDAAFGYHTYDSLHLVRRSDLYDLASITKVTTAVPALMYMLDEGLIDLDEKLCTYFDNFCSSDKQEITLREALAHNGRLQPYIVYWQNTLRKNGSYKWWTFKKKPHRRYPIKITDSLYLHRNYKRKIEKAIKRSDLNPEPGYVYSGLTFLMYPDLVKQMTGMRIDTFLYNYLYRPIGADRLVYRPSDTYPLEQIIPTEVDTMFRYQLIHGSVHDEAAAMLDGISCNAGLFSNAADLMKLCQLYLNRGSYGGETFFSDSIMEEFARCQYCEEDNRRGLGFDKPMIEYDERYSYVAQSATPSSFGHSGFTGTFFWVDPEAEIIIVFLSNRVYPTRDRRGLYQLGIRPALHQAVYDFFDAGLR